MSRARWSEASRIDLDNVSIYYEDLSPDYADLVGRKALAAGRFLAANPGAGSPMSGDLRKWNVPGTPYRLIYRREGDGVFILRLRHASENWREPL